MQAVERDIAMDLMLNKKTLSVTAAFKYRSRTPYEVQVTFTHREQFLAYWVFSRSLLMQGVTRPVGEGSVRVWPGVEKGQPVAYLGFYGDRSGAVYRTRLADLVNWNTRTEILVPVGSEYMHVDVDAGLAALLAG
ncbi:SsgA family sporulation/cell division regulator [Streptomyces sp. NPDC002537]